MQIANNRTSHLSHRAIRHEFLFVQAAQRQYIVKLHFAETYEDITGRDSAFSPLTSRVMSSRILMSGKAGGAKRAYIETVNVDITNGKLTYFHDQYSESEINGLRSFRHPNA